MRKTSPKSLKPVSKTDQRIFTDQLKAAEAEKDVEAAYKQIFQKYYQTTFPSPYGSDGYIEPLQQSLIDDGLRLLLEAKFKLDLGRPQERAKVIAQAIYYLKKFAVDGRSLPNVIVAGDENQMFTVYAPKLYHYLDKDYDWSVAPSSAWQENPELYRELLTDPNLGVYVFDTTVSAFDINSVFQSIDALSHQNGEFMKLKVNEANLRLVFDEFVRMVFGAENWLTGVRKIGATEAVSIFILSILGNQDVYIVPTKKNVLHLVGGKEVRIDAGNYYAFFSRFDRSYSAKEIDSITAVSDQLIEEIRRRYHGDFWTPTIWANRAVELLDNELGSDWRQKYVVWDSAAGTKNLTRDFSFKELYSSTIHQSEIDMSRQYNRTAETFQYDFLNDDIDASPASDPLRLKMPAKLFEALKTNQPIVFYTNPPYGQATEQGETHKQGIAETAVAKLMQANDMGLGSAELYTQFIYRVQKLSTDFGLTNVHIGFFFNKGFLISPSFGAFTDRLLDQFSFKRGFMINAGEFEGTSSNWGLVFSLMTVRQAGSGARQSSFDFSVERSGDRGVEVIGKHKMQRVKQADSISAWLGEIKLPKTEFNGGRYPRATGGFNLTRGKTFSGFLREGAIGFMHNGGSSVQFSDKYTNLNSTMNFVDHGVSVLPENFERVCVTFASRKSILVDASWVNDKDIFRRPSEAFQNSAEWQEFVHDCVVYSLFHRSSYQTSLRDFEYMGELYDVANQWFFMSRSEVVSLAEKHQVNEVIFDARGEGERFVYEYLRGKRLSDEARSVLEAGRRLVIKTFPFRFVSSQDYPQWHLATWDAGYCQLNKLVQINKHDKGVSEAQEQLNEAMKKLESKIRRLVYRDRILTK